MEMKLNRLPAYTFGWLHMNEAEVKDVPTVRENAAFFEIPPQVRRSDKMPEELKDVQTGSGKEMEALTGGTETVFSLQKGLKAADAVRIQLPCEDGANTAKSFGIEVAEGSSLTVCMEFSGEKDAAGMAAVQTKARLEKHAQMNLIQIIRAGSGYRILNDVGIDCGEGAKVHIIHLFLSGGKIYQGMRANLKGDGSELLADVGYRVGKDHLLDMNYFADQTGKKTKSEMYLNGVLRDQAEKVFRGSIDFKKGSAGSTGTETEEVLLIDDDVENKTIPLILCSEEDVEGTHGATIGQLDEDILFYMESRGLTKEQIYTRMADARIESVVRKIPDDASRERLRSEMEEELRTCRREVRK